MPKKESDPGTSSTDLDPPKVDDHAWLGAEEMLRLGIDEDHIPTKSILDQIHEGRGGTNT
jgi:hypothetical protein